MRPFLRPAWTWLTVRLGSGFIRLIFRLNKVTVLGERHFEMARKSGKPVYVALWHGRLIYSAWYLGEFKPVTLVSRSADGEWIARLLRRWGFTTLRGSSRKGSREALRQVNQVLNAPDTVLAITMDGPLGPAHVAKPGSLAAAVRKGALIVPTSGAASRHWTFPKSWDHFQLPKPFGRIRIEFGEPLSLDPESPAAEMALEVSRQVVELEKKGDALVV